MPRILKMTVEVCGDCPYIEAYSTDCVATAYCKKADRPHPADGKEGIKIMYMEIPGWCPLPERERNDG